MFLFLGWDGGLCGLWMDGREQKIGGGDVRAKALSWDDEWDKPKNVFFGFALLACPQFAISGGGLFVIIAGFGCRVVGVGRWGR